MSELTHGAFDIRGEPCPVCGCSNGCYPTCPETVTPTATEPNVIEARVTREPDAPSPEPASPALVDAARRAETLHEWLEHKPGCVITARGYGRGVQCNCGLSAALAALGAARNRARRSTPSQEGDNK